MFQHHAHDNSDHLSELTKRTDSTFELHHFRSVGLGGVIRSMLILSKANWKDRFETLDSGEVLQIAERDVIERYLAKKAPCQMWLLTRKSFITQTLPTFVNRAEDLLRRNEGNPHFVGKKISLADLLVTSALDLYLGIEGADKIINQKDTPLLLKVKEAIDTNPDYSAYRKSEIFDTLSQASAVYLANKLGAYDPSKSRMFS
ncbi:hypothetical protein BGZ73_007067 [Actinomortierella ambigua]|nr:hypothetical protein BGZ73_007067 [Actinomortierella ambigua]